MNMTKCFYCICFFLTIVTSCSSDIEFSLNVAGDNINVNGRRYVVCDPTYIGASVGHTMPDMDNTTAKVIVLQ